MSSCRGHTIPPIGNHRGSLPGELYRSLGLIELSHQPQDIMNEVKRLTSQPDFIQEHYKEEFLAFYLRWMKEDTPNDDEQLKELNDDLQDAMEALDAFFFAGSLTRPPPYKHYGERLVDLKVQNNIFGVGQPGHQTYLDIGLPVLLGAATRSGAGRATIFIDTLRDGSPRTVPSIIETLVHEMAHAIYFLFACDGADCKSLAALPGILGQRGHGRLWMEMAEYMRDTIQSWDLCLANLCNTNSIRWHNRECT